MPPIEKVCFRSYKHINKKPLRLCTIKHSLSDFYFAKLRYLSRACNCYFFCFFPLRLSLNNFIFLAIPFLGLKEPYLDFALRKPYS